LKSENVSEAELVNIIKMYVFPGGPDSNLNENETSLLTKYHKEIPKLIREVQKPRRSQ
jgi:hypothetical protein